MRFSASMDGFTKALSAFGVAVMVMPLGILAYLTADMGNEAAPWWLVLLVAGIDAVILSVIVAFAPRGYSVISGELRVHRRAGDKVISLSGLAEARQMDAKELRGTIRLWGNGGLFGYYGLMTNATLGRHRWYATRRGNYILVAASGGKLVLTPDEPYGMLQALKPYLKR